MPEKIIIKEEVLVSAMKQFIDECDADELARIAGEIFGGECFLSESEYDAPSKSEYYDFEPNENYFGGLEDLA